jgi:hypothetical protein
LPSAWFDWMTPNASDKSLLIIDALAADLGFAPDVGAGRLGSVARLAERPC